MPSILHLGEDPTPHALNLETLLGGVVQKKVGRSGGWEWSGVKNRPSRCSDAEKRLRQRGI